MAPFGLDGLTDFFVKPVFWFIVVLYAVVWVIGTYSSDIIKTLVKTEDRITLETHNTNVDSVYPSTGRQDRRISVDCTVPVANSSYADVIPQYLEVQYNLLGEHDTIDSRERDFVQFQDISSHSERDQHFTCPISWRAFKDSDTENEPWIEGTIHIEVVPELPIPLLATYAPTFTIPLINKTVDWRPQVPRLELQGTFDCNFSKDDWYLEQETTYNKRINTTDWESIIEQS